VSLMFTRDAAVPSMAKYAFFPCLKVGTVISSLR